MHNTKRNWILPVVAALALAACSGKTPPPVAAAPPASVPAAAPPVVQAAKGLLGQWNGPEGTYLLVGGASGNYALTIRNLDGPRTFQGRGEGDTIHFDRDGKSLVIRPGDGAATGMKWLADKKHCLIIEAGEGYCRD